MCSALHNCMEQIIVRLSTAHQKSNNSSDSASERRGRGTERRSEGVSEKGKEVSVILLLLLIYVSTLLLLSFRHLPKQDAF